MNNVQNFEGHVYLDISNPFVAWNVSRGGFVSADVLHANGGLSEDSIPLSPWSESLFRPNNKARLRTELRLEALRKEQFPKEVSRLSGIFVFGCLEDISVLWETKGWGGHFEDINLADVGAQPIAASKLDANWIPMLLDGDETQASVWRKNAQSYWKGESKPGQDPIWETIVSGGIAIWGTGVKDRGLATVKKMYPETEMAWSYSELAFDVGSLDGIIAPIAVFKDDKIEIECQFRFFDGQDRRFRRDLSNGMTGQSGRIRRFPENLDISFPPITNRVSSERSYSYDPARLMRDLGLPPD